MPAYTPPANDGADFELEAYTAPANDAADFEFIQALRLEPAATDIEFETPTATVEGQDTATVSPEATDARFATPTASLQNPLQLRPQPATAEFETPTATVEGQGTATLSPEPTNVRYQVAGSRIGFPVWLLAGNEIGEITGETATPETLTLAQRVTTTTLENSLRPLKQNEGKVDVLAQDDGGFVAVDRANGNNTFALAPPVRRQPLRESTDVHVRRYEETLVSQELGEWDVELELVKADTRRDQPSRADTAAADEWGLTTRYGTIATERVDAEFLGTGEDGVEQFELTTRLTFNEAHVFEAALNRLAGGRVRQVPDETNVAVDDTSDNAATLTVDAPDGQTVVSDGDYLVREWESERINDGFQTIAVTIAAKN